MADPKKSDATQEQEEAPRIPPPEVAGEVTSNMVEVTITAPRLIGLYHYEPGDKVSVDAGLAEAIRRDGHGTVERRLTDGQYIPPSDGVHVVPPDVAARLEAEAKAKAAAEAAAKPDAGGASKGQKLGVGDAK